MKHQEIEIVLRQTAEGKKRSIVHERNDLCLTFPVIVNPASVTDDT
jgi:hypothetical protein